MANVFEIKYLYELYPNVDFEEEFVTEQTISETHVEYISQATKDAWGDIKDSIHAKRLIQTYKKRHYEVNIKISRNIDVARLAVGFVTLTTTDSDVFTIYDVKTTYEKISNSLNYMLTLDFYRYDDDIINHLSSDNCFEYKRRIPVVPVNELGYNVNNPSYAFNNVDIYDEETGPGTWFAYFKVPLNDLTDTILVADTYYLHTNNPTFNEEKDVGDDYLSFAYCESKDANYVYFSCSKDEIAESFSYNINNLTIDHEPDYRDLPAGCTVANKTISFIIYTFINPMISNVDTPTAGIVLEDGIKENEKFNNKRNASFKVWLITAELYKIEFLNYALFNDILLTLADATEYAPCQVQDIYKAVPKDLLINLHEFDIDLLYKNKTVNINR